jgi:hypothetical protein
MKVSVNEQELYTLSDLQKLVIKDYIHDDVFEDDMKRRLHWILHHLYDQAFLQLKSVWDIKLVENGVKMVPTEKDEYAKLVFSQPNYKDRAARDLEAQAEASKLAA